MNDLTKILIVAAAVAAVFAVLWKRGQVRRLAVYCQETSEELKKCSWPTWDELKGSTTVIVLTIAMLGLFTVIVDRVLRFILFHI